MLALYTVLIIYISSGVSLFIYQSIPGAFLFVAITICLIGNAISLDEADEG